MPALSVNIMLILVRASARPRLAGIVLQVICGLVWAAAIAQGLDRASFAVCGFINALIVALKQMRFIRVMLRLFAGIDRICRKMNTFGICGVFVIKHYKQIQKLTRSDL